MNRILNLFVLSVAFGLASLLVLILSVSLSPVAIFFEHESLRMILRGVMMFSFASLGCSVAVGLFSYAVYEVFK